MKILDVLARLGILRYGAKKGVYKSGTDRPTEFMIDDVYDAERDLVASGKSGKKGAKKITRASGGGGGI